MSKEPLDVEELRRLFLYDPETGVMRWRSSPGGGVTVGSVTGSLCREGYLVLRCRGKRLNGHRTAWAIHYGAWPINQIDHINGDRADNRIANLRDVTPAMNSQNRRGAEPFSKLGVLGVIKPYDRYYAVLGVGNKKIWKGADTLEEAQAAYLELKRLHHPGYVPDEQKPPVEPLPLTTKRILAIADDFWSPLFCAQETALNFARAIEAEVRAGSPDPSLPPPKEMP